MKFKKITVVLIISILSTVHLFSQTDRQCSLIEAIYNDVVNIEKVKWKIYVNECGYTFYHDSKDIQLINDSIMQYCNDIAISNEMCGKIRYYYNKTQEFYIKKEGKSLNTDFSNCKLSTKLNIVPFDSIRSVYTLHQETYGRFGKEKNFFLYTTPILTSGSDFGITEITIGCKDSSTISYIYFCKWENNEWKIVFKFVSGVS